MGLGGTDRILVVGTATDETPVTSVTYGGQPLTFIGAQSDPDDASRVELWYQVAPLTGTQNIVVTLADETDAVGGATSWTGVDQITPLGTPVFAGGESTTATAVVTSGAGQVVVDALATMDIEQRTAGTGQTERWNLGQDDLGGAGSSELGGATVTMSWTMDEAEFWAIGGVPLKPSGG